MKEVTCHLCSNKLQKDYTALNKKLLGRNINKYFCLNCLADYLGSTVDVLLVKIEEFKEQGCI